jgi:ABC-type maltose transport systems, permease component
MEQVTSKKLKIRPAATVKTIIIYLIVLLISFIFAFPCIWLILSSFNANGSLLTLDGFFPESYSFETFKTLFTEKVEHDYMRWFWNTLFVAGVSCVISTILVLAVSYTMSRYRFKSRKQMMKATLLLNIFPNFMNMTALFVIMTQFDLVNNLWGLILLYSSGATMGFLVQKGFFDTIPSTIYDAATLDGATDLRVFASITLPLSKPMIVYTALTAFVWPWSDFMLPKLLLPDKSQWTVAIGLNWLDESKFSIFAAGSVFIAVPIVALYIALSKYLIQGGAAGAVKE